MVLRDGTALNRQRSAGGGLGGRALFAMRARSPRSRLSISIASGSSVWIVDGGSALPCKWACANHKTRRCATGSVFTTRNKRRGAGTRARAHGAWVSQWDTRRRWARQDVLHIWQLHGVLLLRHKRERASLRRQLRYPREAAVHERKSERVRGGVGGPPLACRVPPPAPSSGRARRVAAGGAIAAWVSRGVRRGPWRAREGQ